MSDQKNAPWSVDRWGRFLSGLGVLLCSTLAALHHPAWMIGAIGISGVLVVTSMTGICLLHDLLIKLGAREREDIFLPGGSLRAEIVQELNKKTTSISSSLSRKN